jgi:spermidine synthase
MQNARYDLIIVDLYKGFIIEKNLQNEYFLQKIAQKLQKNGFVIFNVITGQNANFEAKIFLDKLQRIFKDYFCKRIITNTFFFCANPTPKGGDLSMAKKRKKKR